MLRVSLWSNNIWVLDFEEKCDSQAQKFWKIYHYILNDIKMNMEYKIWNLEHNFQDMEVILIEESFKIINYQFCEKY